MSFEIIRWIIALAIAAHGIGHTLFFAVTSGLMKVAGADGGTWLLPNATGGAVRAIGAALWLLVTVGFVASAVGIVSASPWWRNLVIIAAIVSLVLLVLFWNGLGRSWVINAAIFNLVVLAALLIFKWPPVSVVGS